MCSDPERVPKNHRKIPYNNSLLYKLEVAKHICYLWVHLGIDGFINYKLNSGVRRPQSDLAETFFFNFFTNGNLDGSSINLYINSWILAVL